MVMLGELGMGLGSLAGKGALSQPQPRADAEHTEYNALPFRAGCVVPAIQCCSVVQPWLWLSPCAWIGQPGFKDIKFRSTFPSQSASHVCMSLSHNVNPCGY